VSAQSGSVLFCGAWDEGPGYPRTTSLRAGLQSIGLAVRECRMPGFGMGKKQLLRQPWRWPAALWRHARQKKQLSSSLVAALQAESPRCVVVPYPGHLVVRSIAARTRVPVVLDLFLSAYDTCVEDRRLVEPGSLGAYWLQRLDRRACAAADLVLLDTPENAAYVAELTGLPSQRFGWLPVSDPDAPSAPTPWQESRDGILRVLFFGTGVPLHGLRTLIGAVTMAHEVELTIVGGTAVDRAYAKALLGERLVLEPEFVARDRLQDLLTRSQLVAGVFGEGGKAQRVVPFKLVHALAAGRPVITADTPAVAGWLDGCGAVWTSPAGDAQGLGAQLRELAANQEQVRAAAAVARAAYDRHFGTGAAGERWRELLVRADLSKPRRAR
jgi:glycosyltransferase involved in cell wall biosynthesis